MNRFIKMTALVAAVLLILCSCSAKATPESTDTGSLAKETAAALIEMLGFDPADTGSMFADSETYPAGSSLYDWTAMAMHLLGYEADYEDYLASLEEYVSKCYAEDRYLDRNKATEWARLIIVITSLGGDPTSFGTDGNGAGIDLVADGTYNYINEDLGRQGVNGYVFALIALKSGDYKVPEDARFTEGYMIEKILESQNDDGGFGLMENVSEADITAMVLHAFSMYRDYPGVSDASERGIAYLKDSRLPDGNYEYYGVKTCECLGQVINCMVSMGMDPKNSEAFGSKPVYDLFMSYRLKNGSFAHAPGDGDANLVTTEQSLLSLISVMNYENGKGSVYKK